MEEQEETSPKHGRKLFKRKPILFTALVVILVAAASGGMYYWQHKKLNVANQKLYTSNQNVSNLDGKVAKLKDQLSTLESNYKKTTDELNKIEASDAAAANSSQSNLTLTVDSSTRFNIEGAINTPNNGVAVNVTLTNPTSTTIYLSTGSFKLQDANENTYPSDPYQTNSLPSNYVVLVNQSIGPHATVKGALYFQVNNLSLKGFTLINETKSYQFTTP